MGEQAPWCPECDEMMEWQQWMFEIGQLRNDETFKPCSICKGEGGYWICPYYESHQTSAEFDDHLTVELLA